MPSSMHGDGSGFFPINIDLSRLLPDLRISRDTLRYPKCVLQANGLPVVIKGGHGLMLRLTVPFGFQGQLSVNHLDVHDEDNLLTVRVKGALRGVGDTHTVELLHVESRHDGHGSVARLMQMTQAQRRTVKGRTRTELAAFVLDIFRPETV